MCSASAFTSAFHVTLPSSHAKQYRAPSWSSRVASFHTKVARSRTCTSGTTCLPVPKTGMPSGAKCQPQGSVMAPGGSSERLDNPHPVPRRLAVCQRRVAANQPKGPKGGEIPDQACLKSACSLSSPSPYGRPENNTYGDWPRTYPNKAPVTR